VTGAILWFTGLSGGGKSTLANAVGARLEGVRAVEILDGDEVRTHLSKGLGFSREDRDTNVRRIGFVARLLAKHGVFVITAAISPYKDTREEIRQLAVAAGIPFIEVFVNPTLDALVKRDVKGLYKKALAGEIAHFTGVSDPYEPPDHPDLVIKTDSEPVGTSVETIIDALVSRGVVPQDLQV
jgi:adenylylsulfate kinase